MILIIDSGSTKSSWSFIDLGDGRDFKFESIGLNPLTNSTIDSDLMTFIPSIPKDYVESTTLIHFFGAGCIGSRSRNVIQTSLKKFFKKTEINVESDIMGAAKACMGSGSGIISILGTGTNVGYYDGVEVISEGLGGGYLVGDEGSGFAIGQILLKNYLRNNLKKESNTAISESIGLTKEKLIEEIYRQTYPNRYIANYSQYVKLCTDDEQKRILKQAFAPYITERLVKLHDDYPSPINLVGSIAYTFEEELRDLLSRHGMFIDYVLKNPIDSLTSYYKNGNR